MHVNSAINFGVKPEKKPSKPSSLNISLTDDHTDLKWKIISFDFKYENMIRDVYL